jgi:Ni,Fe-hydrogenase III large subunit
LNSSYTKIPIDAAVHSEDGKVIKCDFKQGSVERSIDLYQRGYTLTAVVAPREKICENMGTHVNICEF